ncbi:MAG: VOC family protein [Alphaproteobacteria bacterium]
MPLRVLGLDHVVLRTRSPEAVLRFYRDVLGCPVERTIEPLGMSQLRAGSALVDVIDSNVWAAPTPPGPGDFYDHFCLAIEGTVEDVLAALDGAGVAHGPPSARYGATGEGPSIYATDPDGRTVELKITEAATGRGEDAPAVDPRPNP